MNAEIITSGTELLLGEIVDTNSAYIARELRAAGVNIYYKISVGDNIDRMTVVLRQSLERADVVIITGGLGPTVDDVTREAVAAATDRRLLLYPECLRQIETIFARWGRQTSENNRRQAFLPEGSIPIENPVGTAPGFIVETERGTVIALPGVPREMEHLMHSAVLPYLRKRSGGDQTTIKAKVLRTVGLGESLIDERIDSLMRMSNPTVGLAAHLGRVDIRITARASTESEADGMIAGVEAQVRSLIGTDAIYGTGQDSLEQVTARLLAKAGVRLALVESATNGDVATALRSAPEADGLLTASHKVSNADELHMFLRLSLASMACYGWVSEMSAAAAAAALSDTYVGGWGLAVLGDMNASDDVYGSDTGQTYVALATPATTQVLRYPYAGTGELSRHWVTLRALNLLRLEVLRVLETRATS